MFRLAVGLEPVLAGLDGEGADQPKAAVAVREDAHGARAAPDFPR